MSDVNVSDALTDERVATCLDEMLPVAYNQVMMFNPTLNQLETSEFKEERNGGARIRTPLRTGKNTSFTTFGKNEPMTPQVYKIMSWCYWNFKQGAANVLVDWVEEREQAGSGNVIDLVRQRVEAVTDGVRESMNNMVWTSAIGNNGKDFNGIPFLIPADPRTGVMAGLDRSLHYWWRNCYWDNTALSYQPHPKDSAIGAPVAVGAFGSISNQYATMLDRMTTMLHNCGYGEQATSYFIITDQLVYEQFIKCAQHMRNFSIAYSSDADIVKYNFGGAMFHNVPVLFDNQDIPSGYMWMINKRYMKLISDSGAWWVWTEERKPYNQFAKVRYLMLRGQIVNFMPCKHAVLQGITAWA